MTGEALSNAAGAIVARGKLVDYLLSETHPDGRGKARFFSEHGFSPSNWEALAAALRGHAIAHRVVATVETAFGVRYVIEGELTAPDGRAPGVRAVWVHTNRPGHPRTRYRVSYETEVLT